jgi:hypothetical protein
MWINKLLVVLEKIWELLLIEFQDAGKLPLHVF